MQKPPHIAVTDDNAEIRGLIREYLEGQGMRVSLADGAGALSRLLARGDIDLVVLDVMMPGEDGLSVCRRLVAGDGPPVIFLSALADDADRIVGLELGADDYLVKPFNPRELLARIRAVLRRAAAPSAARLAAEGAGRVRLGPMVLDLGRRELEGPGGEAAPLSSAEFALLRAFIDHPGLVLSRERLMDLTAGPGAADRFDRSVDNQVSRLRRKLEEDPKSPRLIVTHWGGGYRLAAAPEPA